MAFELPTTGEALGAATSVTGAAAFIAAPPAAVVEFANAAELSGQAESLRSGEALSATIDGGVFSGFDPGHLADMATKAAEVHSTSAWVLAIGAAVGAVAFVGGLVGLNRGIFR